MSRINLWHPMSLYGGGQTFLDHLAAGLRLNGVEVNTFSLDRKLSKPKQKTLPHGTIVNVLPASQWASHFVSDVPTIVTITARNEFPDVVVILEDELRNCPHATVLHDHRGLWDNLEKVLQASGAPVVGVGPEEKRMLCAKSINGVFIPHPFLFEPKFNSHPDKTVHAIWGSRLAWNKHVEWALQANAMLSDEQRIQMWGQKEGAALYFKTKGMGLDKQWRGRYADWYTLFSTAYYAVDLSQPMKYMHSGRSQYSFLQAWAAHCVPIVNRAWCGDNLGEMIANLNCLAVSSPEELADKIRSRNSIDWSIADQTLTHAHDAQRVARMYLDLL